MNKRPACKINDFEYPASDLITSRISTLCRSMACTLMAREACSPRAEQQWLQFFPNKTCAYCGKPASHLDHLYPMIIDKRPTGYGTEPGNLVPCCKDCNQPKGKKEWEDFMRNGNCTHVGSLKNPDPDKAMEERIAIIKAFQKVMPAQQSLLDSGMLNKWDQLLTMLDSALSTADNELNDMKRRLYPAASTAGSTSPTKVLKKSGRMYELDGQAYTQRTLLLAMVKKYCAEHPCVTYLDLTSAFNLKLSFNRKAIIQKWSDLTPKEIADKRAFIDDPIELADKTVVVVNSQVQGKDIPDILKIAADLGYSIK